MLSLLMHYRFSDNRMSNIMVVDDEEVLIELLSDIIEELGYCTITAVNGREAWEILQSLSELPLLLITDRMMPQMNGIELIQRMRHHPRFQHIPTIMMSAAGDDGHRTVADAFVPKPFDLIELSDLIESFIEGPTARSA